ncbi:MAG: hypothetical protein JSV91_11290 [Phycisphaerales bacterium]|nr:MAG: hypothetical protein JSV91_11290 [Phycisphaerales bacterium]
MTEIVKFDIEAILPEPASVLGFQGIESIDRASARIRAMAEEAIGMLGDLASPAAITAGITVSEFASLYQGEGANEPETPVEGISEQAEALALYAATVGKDVSERITECFAAGDCAVGAMLDSAASAAADGLSRRLERRFAEQLAGAGGVPEDLCVLAYSPGYCGWHISGQRRLFEFLKPGQIGITLNDSCLMQPLKSVSGVLIAGRRDIHVFASSYPFCPECRNQTCHRRIEAIMADE